ncbi:MAG: hypothetical protein WAM14_10495 [Candidatus Nitrosopolaris sp.]
MLRALGEIWEFPLNIIQAGVSSLNKRVNSDGGCGTRKDEASNIESTA